MNETPDTSAESVERYSVIYDAANPMALGNGSVRSDPEGRWVRYADYRALAAERDALVAQLATAEAELTEACQKGSAAITDLERRLKAAEAERDAALGVLRDLGFDNAFSVYQAARQKGGEG